MKRMCFTILAVLFVFTATGAEATVRHGCVDPWGKQVINQYNTTIKPTAIAGATAFGGAGGMGGAGGSASFSMAPGAMNQSTTVNAGGSGGGKMEGYLITQFPEPYPLNPANPLTYNGTLTESQYAGDQMWFKRSKWMKEMSENLPNGGKITEALFEKAPPVNFFYVKDGREKREWCDKEEMFEGKCVPYAPQGYYFGNVYCDSDGPKDKPGIVWGGCSRKLIEKGCTYAVLTSGVINQGILSNATNQSGGLSFAGIFGAIFGFNAGGGASNTDHKATAYEIVNLTWGCYGVNK